ncbi:MAG: hypothetical protein ACFUZC_04860 [Chthoniobacteraceae bacterium]
MHYANGREAKIGDRIVFKDYQGIPYAGVVASAIPGSDTCNLNVVPVTVTGTMSVTAREAMHIDDALTVLTPDSTAKPEILPDNSPGDSEGVLVSSEI